MKNNSNSIESSHAVAFAVAEKANSSSIQDVLTQAKQLAGDSMAEAAATDSTDKFPAETFQKIAKAKLLSAPLPRELGGIGLGLENGTTLEMLQLLKHFGRGNLVVGRVYEGHYNALLLLKLFGTKEQFQKYAKEIVEDNKIFGVWNTEAGDGVKIEPLGSDKYRLEGAKTFATGVDFVSRPFVNGVLPDGGWQMCVVPLEKVETKVDASWWQPMGMKSTRSFRVDFSGVELTENDLIGKAGDYYCQPYFSGGAVRFAAVQLGAAETIFDETRKYLRELNRTGDPFQQMRLGEMAIAVEGGNLWLAGAARKFDEYEKNSTEEASEKFLAYANMMRTAVAEICETMMNLCVKCVGARGLNKPYHFERIIRDLTIYLRQPAPDASLAAVGDYVLKNEKMNDEFWQNSRRINE
ncbi:MAG: acyl-CoA dehydrogenase family protein [Acidobacteriota bacterium]|nr:acyl-CoA dehydrogenase family protein [Acidobacteriota bacterium]